MADYPTFTCAYEKDHNPPLDAEAERWFQQARRLERAMGPWPEVERLYQQAIAKNHWKAMHNLAKRSCTDLRRQPDRLAKLGQPTPYIQDCGMTADDPVIKRLALGLETRPHRN